MASEKLPILMVGADPATLSALGDTLKNAEITTIPMDIEQLLSPISPPPCMIIVGPPQAGLPAPELAQALRMQYQETPIYLCCVAREGFERKNFIKNGFTDAFLIPMDTTNLRTALSEALARITSGEVKVYRPVKIIDLKPGDALEFDTSFYMPANNKYLKMSMAGDSLDEARVEKIKKSKLNSVYVPAEQMQKFYQYSAKRLQEMGSSTFSATERKEKLATAVRDLMSGLFSEQNASFETGQSIMKDCGEIVKTYIVQGGDSEWYSRIQQVLGSGDDTYSQSANVSTLAALFSMGLGIGKPEDLALAGLLHNIGIAELPPEIQALDPEDLTPEQFEQYKKYVQSSINLIKARKIVVPENVMKAILQHQELYNGTGFPSGLFGDRISKEAQVLALAHRFETLTRVRPGKPTLTPLQAVEKLRQMQVNDPSRIHYNPEILKSLLTLFPA